jgi:hypothetical protein
MAERLGEALLPSLQAAQEAERAARRASARAGEEAEVAVPHVPHVLPFTRWWVDGWPLAMCVCLEGGVGAGTGSLSSSRAARDTPG